MTALLVIMFIAAYIYTAFVVGKLIYNHKIEPVYREIVKSIQSDKWEIGFHERNGKTVEQAAYAQAQLKCDAEIGATLAVLILPVGIVYLACLKMGNPPIPMPKNVAQKDMEAKAKIAQQKELEDSKREEWLKAIRETKEMGIDTSKLEQAVSEYFRATSGKSGKKS